MKPSLRESPKPPAAAVLAIATWFALVAGTVEGIVLWGVFERGWINVSIRHGVTPQIIWISPVFDLVFFLAIAILLVIAGSAVRRVPIVQAAILVFPFLTFFDWISLPFRLKMLSVASLSAGLTAILFRWFLKHEEAMLRFWRRTLPLIAAVVLVALVSIQSGNWLKQHRAMAQLPAAPKDAPNILVLVVDTLRADHLSLYGYDRPTSPNLEAIAKQGVMFDDAISPSSWTLPAHASMLTGLLPHEHGAAEEDPLDHRNPTIGEILQAHGYRTAGFSGNSLYFSRRAGLNRGFIYFDDYFYSMADRFGRTLWGRLTSSIYGKFRPRSEFPIRQRAEVVNRKAFEWIDSDHSHPFFAFLNYFDVHNPYLPPRPYRGRFSKVKDPGGWLREDNSFPRLTPEQMQEEVDAYDGGIVYVDTEIENIFSELKQRGLDKNTLVIITADHGESFGDHGLLKHRNALYRELIRVPLVVWWPGTVPAGLHVATPVSTASLPATLLEAVVSGDAGFRAVNVAPRFSEPSLSALWTKPEDHADWPLPLSELTQDPYLPAHYPAHYGGLECITGPQWHLTHNEKQPPEFYRWTTDPQELKNEAEAPGAKEEFTRLESVL